MDTRQQTALLLIAHGSRYADANADLHQVAAALKQQGAYDMVQPSFLELASPTIEQAAELCVQAGARRVILVPYFLSAGVHVLRDLSEARSRLADQFPAVKFLLAQPLGPDARLQEIVLDRANDATCGIQRVDVPSAAAPS